MARAFRWFAYGDQPQGPRSREGLVVRLFRRPDIPGQYVCDSCARTMDDHGWIDVPEYGHTVCPGDWVVDDLEGPYPVKHGEMASRFHLDGRFE